MESRYRAEEAARFCEDRRATYAAASADLLVRTYTARLLGQEPSLVLHGGGNTSIKSRVRDRFGHELDVMFVKGSGSDLGTIEPPGHPAVRLEPLRRLRQLTAMTDEDMVNELRLALLDAHAPTPSVETLLHAFLPDTCIDHTHADAIVTLVDQPDGERICRELFGPSMVWVPYVMPGFALAQRCAEAYEASRRAGHAPSIILLEQHGIFTVGRHAEESYTRMIDAVTHAERAIAARRPARVSVPNADERATFDVLPRIRGTWARLAEMSESGPMLSFRTSASIVAFMERPDFRDLVARGCATPDHVLRTKPHALIAPRVDSHPEAWATALERDMHAYARAYDGYFDDMCRGKGVRKKKLDPWPRVILVPGLGLCACGATKRDADIVADVYEHTIDIMTAAADMGSYAPVGLGDLFDVEYWSLEQAKLKPSARQSLSGRVVLVTGAASGIGLATAHGLVAEGAHVVLVDRDASALEGARAACSPMAQASIFAADVTNPHAVHGAFAHAVSTFGGVDIVVSNAGTAPEGRLDQAAGDQALRASLDVNLLAHNTVASIAVGIFLAQGTGGCLLFNASKSAFNPGPGFGPYAVAKAALVALMRQYAVDLGPRGIRANAVNADRIRTQLFGAGVAESRAKARGLSVDQYFQANLLGREVSARDVAKAFAYLAAAPTTTGAVLTVDGGNPAAFPR